MHDYKLTDHMPISFRFQVVADKKMIEKQFRIFLSVNFRIFREHETELFNSYSLPVGDVNDEVRRLNNWIQMLLDKYFPVKTKIVSVKSLQMPWRRI